MDVNDDGTVTFGGKCLDVTGSATTNGTKVQLWQCTGATNQDVGGVTVDTAQPGLRQCLDDPSGSTTDGTQLQIFTCNVGTAQQWFQGSARAHRVTDGAWHHATVLAVPVPPSRSISTATWPSRAARRPRGSDPAVRLHRCRRYRQDVDWSGREPDSYFNGKIAEVALYRTALSANTIASQFNAFGRSSGAPVQTTTLIDPGGKTAQHIYDMSTGRQVAEVDTLGHRTQYAYDPHGFLASVIDPNGNTTSTTRDARGNVLSSVTCQDQAANKCSTVYYTYFPENTTDPAVTNPKPTPGLKNDLLLTVRDGRSGSGIDNTYKTTYGYDLVGNRTSVTDPLGRVISTTYTTASTPAQDGGTTPAGLPSVATAPSGAVQTFYYNHSGDIAKTVDAVGLVTTFGYDALGRQLTSDRHHRYVPGRSHHELHLRRAQPAGHPAAPPITDRVTGAVHTAVATTVFDYDSLITSQTVADMTGGDATRGISTVYNTHGLEDSTTDATGKTTSFLYDVYGNMVQETDADTGVIDSAWDAEGHLLTSTLKNYIGDPNNPSAPADLLTTSRAYDPAGRLASTKDAMGWLTSYTYTDNDMVLTITRSDPSSGASFVQRRNDYDAAGNITSQVTNDGRRRSTTRSTRPTGPPRTRWTRPVLNRATSYTYSPDDYVTSTTRSDAAGTASIVDATYDGAGRALTQTVHTGTANLTTTFTRDEAGVITAMTDPRGNTTNYSIDEAGRTVVTVQPSVQTETGHGETPVGVRPVTYLGYNTFGEAVESKDANGNVTIVGYDAGGRQTSTQLPSYTPPGSGTPITPTTGRTYNLLGQLATSTDALGNTTTYSYDQLGNLSKKVAPATATTTATTLITHDTLGDQLSVTDPTGAVSGATYDYLGRRITATASVRQTNQAYTTTYNYGSGGWLSSLVTPDGVTTTTTYNNLGEPVSVSDGVHNATTTAYDGAGRVSRTTLADGSYNALTYDLAGRPTVAASYSPTWYAAAFGRHQLRRQRQHPHQYRRPRHHDDVQLRRHEPAHHAGRTDQQLGLDHRQLRLRLGR